MAGTDLFYSCVLGFEIEKKKYLQVPIPNACRNFDLRYFAVSQAHPDDLEFNTSYRRSSVPLLNVVFVYLQVHSNPKFRLTKCSRSTSTIFLRALVRLVFDVWQNSTQNQTQDGFSKFRCGVLG